MDQISLTFAALSDPTRRQILARLRTGAAAVNELAEPFGVSQQAISKHLAYLERAQLIEKRKVGRLHVCTLSPKPLQEAQTWFEAYAAFWEDAFDRLEAVAKTIETKKGKKAEP